jgi:hypothetical protein
MDWKYRRFRREQTFPKSRETVLQAARECVADGQAWSITDTSTGFEAKGYSGFHLAAAAFDFAQTGDGATMTVDLRVERASNFGFMLFEIGGYYDGLLARWIEGVRQRVDDRFAGVAAAHPPRAGHARLFDTVVMVLAFFRGLAFVLNFVVFPLIALVTGNLYFIGRGSSGPPLHGAWARGVSVALLLVDAWIAYRIFGSRRRGASAR